MPRLFDQVKKQTRNNECLSWDFLKKYILESEDDDRVSNVFAMVVYGMVIFPKVPDHDETAVGNLIEQLNGQANPVMAIIAETICSLSYCHRTSK